MLIHDNRSRIEREELDGRRRRTYAAKGRVRLEFCHFVAKVLKPLALLYIHCESGISNGKALPAIQTQLEDVEIPGCSLFGQPPMEDTVLEKLEKALSR